MTVGQRIAQKRKELGLSQEGLGERLGVSRQAIYKWESGAALPEIEKLVNLSREFSVSIDWLLGEGDEARELTPDQLRMVEEIVGRYLAARPPEHTAPPQEEGGELPPKPKRRRWRWVAAAAAVLVLIGVFSNLFSRLDQMRQENQNLQMAVANIRSDVNQEIYGITQRVEDVLQSQNRLTAEQSAQVTSTDYRANTVTITAQAVPRTYVEGMTAEFILDSDGETFTVTGELGADHAFTAELTGPLTDDISVSVAFLTGEQRQTQVLERFTSLYSISFPDVFISGGMSSATQGKKEQGGWLASYDNPIDVHVSGGNEVTKLASLRLGLFREQELVTWFTQEERPNFTGSMYTFRLDQNPILLENGHTYCLAAVAVDEYGREWVVSDHWPQAVTEDHLETAGYVDEEYSRDPADWTY